MSTGKNRVFVGQLQKAELEQTESVLLTTGPWHHVAIGRDSAGTSMIWVDGRLVLEGKLTYPWPEDSRWLTVGSSLDGTGCQEAFRGVLQDICAFDRILSE